MTLMSVNTLESAPLNRILKKYSQILVRQCPWCQQKPFENIIAKWNREEQYSCFRCQPSYSLTKIIFNHLLGLTELENEFPDLQIRQIGAISYFIKRDLHTLPALQIGETILYGKDITRESVLENLKY